MVPEHGDDHIARSTARQLDHDLAGRPGSSWWETPTADVVVDLAKAGPFVVALAGVIEVLREGHDPLWVAGGESTAAAFQVVHEWLAAGVDPGEVAGWLRAGCWKPQAAAALVGAGIRPSRLVGHTGEPLHMLDVGPDGPIPPATAVAEEFITVDQAVRHVTGR